MTNSVITEIVRTDVAVITVRIHLTFGLQRLYTLRPRFIATERTCQSTSLTGAVLLADSIPELLNTTPLLIVIKAVGIGITIFVNLARSTKKVIFNIPQMLALATLTRIGGASISVVTVRIRIARLWNALTVFTVNAIPTAFNVMMTNAT